MRQLISLFAAVAALSACGGGGDDSPAPAPAPAPVASSSPAGVWRGNTSTGREASAIVLSTGQYWVIYSAASNVQQVAGAAQGTAAISGNTLASTDGLDFNLEGLGVTAASFNATFGQANFLNGTVHYPNQTVTFNSGFLVLPAANLADLAGSYRGVGVVSTGNETTTFTVNAAGAISGSGASGCKFTGVATPRSDVTAYAVTVTFGGGVCALGTSTVSGVAYFDLAAKRLYSAAVNPARSNGFLMIAVRT